MTKLILAAALMGYSLVQAADCPLYPDDVRDLLLMPQIKERQSDLIRDAAFSQDGCKISLVLIVNAAITVEHAKDLGDDFARLTKAFAPRGKNSESPSKEGLGRGTYDYLIGVYTAQGKEIALGAKVAAARRISW